MIDTFARCVVSYQARGYSDLPAGMPDPAMEAMEHAIVDALRRAAISTGPSARSAVCTRVPKRSALQSFGLLAAAESGEHSHRARCQTGASLLASARERKASG